MRLGDELIGLHEVNAAVIEYGKALLEKNDFLRRVAVISNVDCDNCGKVAITIDDGGNHFITELALSVLREKEVSATLFPTGLAVARHPGLYRQAEQDGHEFGNHTYSHSQLTSLSDEGIRNQLQGWQNVVNETLGYPYETRWFRPPGRAGFTDHVGSPRYRDIIAEHGMATAMWSVETVHALYKPDGPQHRGENPTSSDVARYVVIRAQPGGIILLHFNAGDMYALSTIIDDLRAKGLEPVTLTELVSSVPLPDES